MALFILPIFWNLSGNSFVNQMSLTGCIFFLLTVNINTNVNATILVFQDERPVFLREYAKQMYGVPAYYLAKVIMEMPMMIFLPLLNALIIYFGVGLTITASQFFIFYLVNILVAMCASSFGYFVSSIFSSAETAVGAVPMIILPMMLVGGFTSNVGTFPDWIMWFQYISPVRYGMEALVINEFGSREYGPEDVDFLEFTGFNIGMWQCILLLVAIILVMRTISMVSLWGLVSKFQ